MYIKQETKNDALHLKLLLTLILIGKLTRNKKNWFFENQKVYGTATLGNHS